MRLVWCIPLVVAFGCAHQKSQVKEAPLANVSSPPTTKEAAVQSGENDKEKLHCDTIRVHFDFNASEIHNEDKGALEQAAQCLKNDQKLHVTIEGNTDERGTEEYNLALGDQRAQAVARYLQMLGTSSAQLKTISYGKEQPECREHDESCWAKNRRAAVRPVSYTK